MTFRFERQLGSRRSARKGFTLIELLVVIAIIGILAAVVLVSLNSARIRGRDARRLSDLQAVSLAMEVYNDQNNGLYPATGVSGADTAAPTGPLFTAMIGTLAASPSKLLPSATVNDPLNSGSNVYYGKVSTAQTSYTVGAQLEQDNQACKSDYDGSATALGGTACGDGATADNCSSTDAAGPDYCICQGPAC